MPLRGGRVHRRGLARACAAARVGWLCLMAAGVVWVASGCGVMSEPPVPTLASGAAPGYPEPLGGESFGIRPRLSDWDVLEEGIIVAADYALAVQAAYLSEQQTTVFYSLSGLATRTLIDQGAIELLDNQGQGLQLLGAWAFAVRPGLELGVMRFACRCMGATTLSLAVTTPNGRQQADVAELVRFEGDSLDSCFSGRYAVSRSEDALLGGHRVAFDGWGCSPEASPGNEATRTVPVLQSASFRIEDLLRRESLVLLIELLTDGNVLGYVNDSPVQPWTLPSSQGAGRGE